MTRKQSVSISLETDQVERLDRIARETKIRRSVLVQEAVDKIILDYERRLGLPSMDENR